LFIPVRSAVARASGKNKKSINMQRLAAFSFLGVVVLLVAFTLHETKKPDLAARTFHAKGKI
jgi:hypothetical protein